MDVRRDFPEGDNVDILLILFRSLQVRCHRVAFRGSSSQIFCVPLNFVAPREFYTKHMITTKTFLP